MKIKFLNTIKEYYKEYMEAEELKLAIYDDSRGKLMNLYTNVKDWFIDMYKNPKELYRLPIRKIKNFWSNLKRSSKWFYRMWNNQDYDYDFLIEMMIDKMKDMRYQFDVTDAYFVDLRHQPTGSYTGEESDSDYPTVDVLEGLDKAIEVGERILANNYVHNTPEINDWFNKNGYFSEMPDNLEEELTKIYKEADKSEKNDRNEFFNLIRDNHQYWWS